MNETLRHPARAGEPIPWIDLPHWNPEVNLDSPPVSFLNVVDDAAGDPAFAEVAVTR